MIPGLRSPDCTEENAKSADAQVRDAIIRANDDENAASANRRTHGRSICRCFARR
jgi:hypothetical protein